MVMLHPLGPSGVAMANSLAKSLKCLIVALFDAYLTLLQGLRTLPEEHTRTGQVS